MDQIPNVYRKDVLDISPDNNIHIETDPYCLAMLKHYRSLMPLAMEARKPMFYLKPADGAIGSLIAAAQSCAQDFKLLAKQILDKDSLLEN